MPREDTRLATTLTWAVLSGEVEEASGRRFVDSAQPCLHCEAAQEKEDRDVVVSHAESRFGFLLVDVEELVK